MKMDKSAEQEHYGLSYFHKEASESLQILDNLIQNHTNVEDITQAIYKIQRISMELAGTSSSSGVEGLCGLPE